MRNVNLDGRIANFRTQNGNDLASIGVIPMKKRFEVIDLGGAMTGASKAWAAR